MKASNRDLLVLVKDEYLDQQEMEMELEKLNSLLYESETTDKFCLTHELLDINKHKIVEKRKSLVEIAYRRPLKPFQFLFNKN